MADLRTARWTTSSYSAPQGENCVQAALNLPGHVVAVRDSKHPDLGAIVMTSRRWRRITDALKAG